MVLHRPIETARVTGQMTLVRGRLGPSDFRPNKYRLTCRDNVQTLLPALRRAVSLLPIRISS
jgi:hypothetical protein